MRYTKTDSCQYTLYDDIWVRDIDERTNEDRDDFGEGDRVTRGTRKLCNKNCELEKRQNVKFDTFGLSSKERTTEASKSVLSQPLVTDCLCRFRRRLLMEVRGDQRWGKEKEGKKKSCEMDIEQKVRRKFSLFYTLTSSRVPPVLFSFIFFRKKVPAKSIELAVNFDNP